MWQKEGEAKKRQNELTSERGRRTINRPTQRRVCVRAMALLPWWCKSANTRKDLHEMLGSRKIASFFMFNGG